MFLHCLGIYKDVIQVYYYSFVQQIEEDSMHHSLKGAGGVAQSKGHDCELKGSIPA
jgi:hypothetical protein